MDDSGPSNISRVGHRRWILNPSMGKVAFGAFVTGSNALYSAMYAHDRSGTGSQAPVAWPAAQTPISYFQSRYNYAWSVSFGYSVSKDSVSVELTRVKDGKVWNFSSAQADGEFYVDNGYYGQIGCVIFAPSGNETYSAGDIFNVKITDENKLVVLNYSVQFFNL